MNEPGSCVVVRKCVCHKLNNCLSSVSFSKSVLNAGMSFSANWINVNYRAASVPLHQVYFFQCQLSPPPVSLTLCLHLGPYGWVELFTVTFNQLDVERYFRAAEYPTTGFHVDLQLPNWWIIDTWDLGRIWSAPLGDCDMWDYTATNWEVLVVGRTSNYFEDV